MKAVSKPFNLHLNAIPSVFFWVLLQDRSLFSSRHFKELNIGIWWHLFPKFEHVYVGCIQCAFDSSFTTFQETFVIIPFQLFQADKEGVCDVSLVVQDGYSL